MTKIHGVEVASLFNMLIKNKAEIWNALPGSLIFFSFLVVLDLLLIRFSS